MWEFDTQLLNDGRVKRYALRRDGSSIRYRDVLQGWKDDEGFRSFFTSLLADAPYSSYRWETPPITAVRADRDFEFVLLDAPGLARVPDEKSFADQFRSAKPDEQVIAFPNLRNDAMLVVPRPWGEQSAYVHLAAFVRNAPAGQVHELWRCVGAAMILRLSANTIWLSTAGMGVSWLHVRLDSQPKYYGFETYRKER